METFASRLARARALAGNPSPTSLSRVAGLAAGHVRAIEAGQFDAITMPTAEKLCRVLGITAAWLLYGAGPEPRESSVRRAWERATREAA